MLQLPVGEHLKEYKDVLKDAAGVPGVTELTSALKAAMRQHKNQVWKDQAAVLIANQSATVRCACLPLLHATISELTILCPCSNFYPLLDMTI